jgi:hypothetical protein
VWLETTPDEIDLVRDVTYALRRWEEILDTNELPRECARAAAGVTWMDLWADKRRSDRSALGL